MISMYCIALLDSESVVLLAHCNDLLDTEHVRVYHSLLCNDKPIALYSRTVHPGIFKQSKNFGTTSQNIPDHPGSLRSVPDHPR